MSEFKITPQDVGQVAIDAHGYHWRILDVDYSQVHPVTARNDDECLLFFQDGSCGRKNDTPLVKWKPRTLVAEKQWWVVYRNEGGHCWGEITHDADWEGTYPDLVVARVYAEHWHGCEEGRFDTPDALATNTQG